MFKSRIPFSLLVVCLNLLVHTNCYAIPSGFQITEIANNTGPLNYQYYSWAAMNESGQVCYQGSSTSNNITNSAILKGDGIQRQSIAATNDGSGLYNQFVTDICSINDAGDVAFDGCTNCNPVVQNIPVGYGVYKRLATGTLLVLKQSGPLSDDFRTLSLPTINNAGDVSFSGEQNSGRQGIWIRGSGATITNPFSSDGIFAKLGGAFLNDSRQITFGGEEDTPPSTLGNAGIYGPSANLLTGTANGFSKVSLSAMNNGGNIVNLAIKANSNSGAGGNAEQGVYLNGNPFLLNSGDFHRVDISSFQAVSINDQGDVVFPAFRPNGNSVIFFGVNGGMLPLIERGDFVPGHASPVDFATVSRESINNSRQIAITVRLQDGLELVLRFDPVSVVFPDDQCPADNTKFLPGVCGCGISDIDSNSDGTLDCQVTPTVRQLTSDALAALKKVKLVSSSSSKKAKKAKKANSAMIKSLKRLVSQLNVLVRGSSTLVNLTSNKKSALQLVSALKAPVTKATKLNRATFAKDKKAASKVLSTFLKALAVA